METIRGLHSLIPYQDTGFSGCRLRQVNSISILRSVARARGEALSTGWSVSAGSSGGLAPLESHWIFPGFNWERLVKSDDEPDGEVVYEGFAAVLTKLYGVNYFSETLITLPQPNMETTVVLRFERPGRKY